MPWSVVGHDWAVELLRRSLASGRTSHAYLFCGPPQVGKATLARTLAQALNCERPDPPCGLCSSCSSIHRGSHPDVQVVQGRGSGGAIQIDQIRSLQRDAALSPYLGRQRVIILRQVERATPEASNSLLKTLEEPPGRTNLVLTASQRELLPPTIVSRCQVLDLRPVAPAAIEQALLDRGLGAPHARMLARVSAGRPAWALSASQDETLLRDREQDLEQLLELMGLDRMGRLDLAWKMSRDASGCLRKIERWTGWWRDLLLVRVGRPDHVANVDQMGRLGDCGAGASPYEAWCVLRALGQAAQQLQDNANPRLALEGLMFRLPHWPGAGIPAQREAVS